MTKFKNLHCLEVAKNLPINLSEIKQYLRLDFDCDDALLTKLCRKVTRTFENYTSHILVKSAWEISVNNYTKSSLTLPIAPLISVEKITQHTHLGVSQNFPLESVRISPRKSEVHFSVHPLAYQLQIEFWAGYGDDEQSVPDDIKSLLLSHIAFLYENRSSSAEFPLSVYNEYKTWRL